MRRMSYTHYFIILTSEKNFIHMQQSIRYSDRENKLWKCKGKKQLYLYDK